MPIRVVCLSLTIVCAAPAAAQEPPGRLAAELVTGWAGFVDEEAIQHAVAGGSLRYYLTPRLSVGPEVVYMRGPGFDRDWFVTGTLTFDILREQAGASRRPVVPFLVVGGGLEHHRDEFFRDVASTEGAVTGGGGVRISLGDRAYALGEARIGWEPHVRVAGGIGIRF